MHTYSYNRNSCQSLVFSEISSSPSSEQNIKAVNNTITHKSSASETHVWLLIFFLTHDSQQSLIINVPKMFLIHSLLFIKLASSFTQFLIISGLEFFSIFLGVLLSPFFPADQSVLPLNWFSKHYTNPFVHYCGNLQDSPCHSWRLKLLCLYEGTASQSSHSPLSPAQPLPRHRSVYFNHNQYAISRMCQEFSRFHVLMHVCFSH